MSAAETDEKTLPMTDTHYAVSIRRIYDAHTDMLKGYKLILWEMQEKARIAVAARDYPTGMLEPIPQQTLDDADTLARIFQCKNYRNDETEMWEWVSRMMKLRRRLTTATLVPDRAASRTREEPMAEHGHVRRARRMA